MYICPTIGEDHEKDFLVTGSLDDFKIIVFSNLDEYEKGFEYLQLVDYAPTEVSIELFEELAKNDDAFSGIILNIHKENKIIKIIEEKDACAEEKKIKEINTGIYIIKESVLTKCTLF